ncbi:MAG: dTDP-4-dehydrorhamnose reductase [Vulcanimicrobiaceae bacterium]
MTPRRVAIIGASGQLGSALVGAFEGREVIAPSHGEVPFEQPDAVARLLEESQPDVVINCSAFHHVDTCEREPERAFALNAIAVDGAAAACTARDTAFVTISTDYVFDGTLGRAYREDDAPNPRTAYGTSKLAGELLARRHGPRIFIVRTSAVFGTAGTSNKGYTLIEKVLQQAERGEPTRMVSDMIFSPSYAPDVARAIRDLIDVEAYGTHHVTNAGACSWYEFVRTAFAKAGLAGAPLEPITYASFGNPTQRPMYSPLENTTFARAGIAPLRSWQDALDAYLQARRSRAASVPSTVG